MDKRDDGDDYDGNGNDVTVGTAIHGNHRGKFPSLPASLPGRDVQWTVEMIMMVMVMTSQWVLGFMEIIVEGFHVCLPAYQNVISSGQ